jgi:hypothetical protein
MAESNIVAGLFGMTPEMYQGQQYNQDLKRSYELAQLDPGAAARAQLGASVGQIGRGFAGAMGIEDPQLKLISARNTIAQQIDQTNPESILKGAQMLAQMGDQQGAMALAQYARQAQSEMALAQQRMAEKMTPEQRNAMAFAGSVAEKGTPQFNQIYQRTLADLISKEKPDLKTPEQKNAMALALTAGPEGSAAFDEKYASELARLTDKAKQVGPNVKEIGVAETSREPVYLDVNNDLQFIYKKDESGKQVRVPFTGGVDRTTAKTDVGVKLPPGESEFVKRLGTKDADRVDNAITMRENATSTINSLNKLASLPDNQLITGQFATGRVGATNLLVTLGLAAPSDTNKLVSSQEYQKVAGDVILQTLGGKLGSGFSNADREFIQGLIPQLETNPAARRQLISFMQNKNQEIIKETIRLEQYARQNKGLSGFEPKIPLSVAPSQPRPYSGLSDEQLNAKIRAAQAQQPQ